MRRMGVDGKNVIYFELFGSFSIGTAEDGERSGSIVPGKAGKKVLSFLQYPALHSCMIPYTMRLDVPYRRLQLLQPFSMSCLCLHFHKLEIRIHRLPLRMQRRSQRYSITCRPGPLPLWVTGTGFFHDAYWWVH